MSVRESIENPMALCSTHNRYQWMTEGQDSSRGVSNISQQSAWQVVSIWGASSAGCHNVVTILISPPKHPLISPLWLLRPSEWRAVITINQSLNPENPRAFGANVIRVIGDIGDNITSDDHTYRFNGVSDLSKRTIAGTWDLCNLEYLFRQ